MTENDMTTIAVSQKHRTEMIDISKKDQSYDDILGSLLDFWKRYKGIVKKA